MAVGLDFVLAGAGFPSIFFSFYFFFSSLPLCYFKLAAPLILGLLFEDHMFVNRAVLPE